MQCMVVLQRRSPVAVINVHQYVTGKAWDLESECSEYEAKIKEAGGIDLFIGGKSSRIGDVFRGYPCCSK